MKLNEYLNTDAGLYRAVRIGKEMMINDIPSILLVVQETDNFGDEEDWDEDVFTHYDTNKMICRLVALCETYDEDEDYDEFHEIMTNRQAVVRFAQADTELDIDDAEWLIVNEDTGEETFEIVDVQSEFVDCCDYRLASNLKRLISEGYVPDEWLQKDASTLSIAEYLLEADSFDRLKTLSENSDMSIRILPGEHEQITVLNKPLKLNFGTYDIPRTMAVQDANDNIVPFKIHGVFAVDAEQLMNLLHSDENDDDDELTEMIQDIVSNVFRKDEKYIFVAYSSQVDVTLEFYMKEFLDSTEMTLPIPVPDFSTGEPDEEGIDIATKCSIAAVTDRDYQENEELDMELLICRRYI